MDTINAMGNKIEMAKDGSAKITTADGKVIAISKDGSANIDLKSISRIGFENILDLKSHTIMREGDLTVHQAVFHDGGRVKIAFTSDGKLVEFSGHNISSTFAKEGAIVLRSHSAAEALKK